jgi:hypothetical protein
MIQSIELKQNQGFIKADYTEIQVSNKTLAKVFGTDSKIDNQNQINELETHSIETNLINLFFPLNKMIEDTLNSRGWDFSKPQNQNPQIVLIYTL